MDGPPSGRPGNTGKGDEGQPLRSKVASTVHNQVRRRSPRACSYRMLPTPYDYVARSRVMVSAAHSAGAAIVSVGLAVPAVGKTPLPSKNRLG